MKRRTFLQTAVAGTMAGSLWAAVRQERLRDAAAVLDTAVENKQVAAAVLHVRQKDHRFTHAAGTATASSPFLLGSISKPICVTALMTLYDRGEFRLDDPVGKFLPKFTDDGRDAVTVQHLLTHVSGLPDQLPDNNELRKKHARLDDFVAAAIRTPLHFTPGTRYEYSSMAILLACEIGRVISGVSIPEFVQREVFRPLKMTRSAQGLGTFQLADLVPVQTERAAPESGGGDPTAKEWDWNSRYWRGVGAPWGGTHASAGDVAVWLDEFLAARGTVIKPETARLMTRNHNPAPLTPRGIGFGVGQSAGSRGCSDQTFGHTGSTGTLAWADPETDTICVVLTSLPGRAVQPHPRELAGDLVAAAVE